ncbi:iron ABC transporter permease [Rivularia sp. UHCC 0363]|uniref:ABC transporter permease n=1 Tax=Rivularia sp. UHCC 0363 TaxID=3110244 RepID=UPI002B1F3DA0|nr:iron ABC transporter permease [Rivularia sp. UHCC 0363]MEA5593536.1 iron ABC transporter permease [Rivularia sp. UHCC 0363]
MSKAIRPPLFLTIAAVVVAIAITLPLFYLVFRAAYVGSEELRQLFTRQQNLIILFNSVVLMLTVAFFSALISVPLAFLTVRTDLPKRRFWLVLTTLPLAVPSYVGSFALIAAFAPRGSFVQLLLAPLGIEELPSIYGWFGAIFALTLFTYPYMLLSLRSALQGLDPSLEEAARSMGYNSRETFIMVVLPQLYPSLITGGLLVALYALRDFGTPSLMQFDAFTQAIFVQYKASFNRDAAAALSLMLVTIVMFILWLEYRMRSRAGYYTRGSASFRPAQPIKLGVWKLPALAFCALISFFGVVLPLITISFWLIQGLLTDYTFIDLLQPTLNSITVAGLAAIITTLFALPIAILSVRFPSKIIALVERSTYICFGVPGIVVALSLVFFGANYLPFLYQTLPMLIFAYLILFLQQSVGTVRTSLLQVNPQVEEAARSLGKSSWQTLKQVTLPLVTPGILSGTILVFITVMKELPATMLLSPIGFDTLAVEIWKATENVDFADAAAASLMILAVSMASTFIVLSQEKAN